jgi:hypothetical protein
MYQARQNTDLFMQQRRAEQVRRVRISVLPLRKISNSNLRHSSRLTGYYA